jgi:hypothetical protein
LSQLHIRVLLGQMDLGGADLDMLALQLTAALDGPLLLYLSASDLTAAPRPPNGSRAAGRTWSSAYADFEPHHQVTAGTIVHIDLSVRL